LLRALWDLQPALYRVLTFHSWAVQVSLWAHRRRSSGCWARWYSTADEPAAALWATRQSRGQSRSSFSVLYFEVWTTGRTLAVSPAAMRQQRFSIRSGRNGSITLLLR